MSETGSDIVLATINARYSHTALALRCLYANLKKLQARTKIVEFTLSQSIPVIAQSLLAQSPKIIALSVYIWNSKAMSQLVRLLKEARPDVLIVLGGPEISYETETHPAFQFCDVVIQGEGEILFHDFCNEYLRDSTRPFPKIVSGELPKVDQISLPYRYYTDEDIRNRVIYVEASRGCPFRCEYCLSSLDQEVRAFPLDSFLSELQSLISRGARRFKFLDRTFNLKISTCLRILDFFLSRMELGLFLHFELIPDRLPEELKESLRKFPPGSLQFEIGVQTWNPEIAARISRRQDYRKLEENFRFLLSETQVHIHADLIAGLPGETLESFASGFDALASLKPQEIQLGILKRLRGTSLGRHSAEWHMIYEADAPYRLISSKTLDRATLDRLVRLAKDWDRLANSGQFPRTMEILRSHAKAREDASLFWLFWDLSAFLTTRHPQSHGVPLESFVESIYLYLTNSQQILSDVVKSALVSDFCEDGKRSIQNAKTLTEKKFISASC